MAKIYTLMDDKKILSYLLENESVHLVGGNQIWKKMEYEGILKDRTFHSLKNRFKRHISKQLMRPEYGLSKEDLRYIQTAMKLKSSYPTDYEDLQENPVKLPKKMKEKPKEKPQEDSDNEKFYSMDIVNSDSDTE